MSLRLQKPSRLIVLLTETRYRPREYDSEDGPWDPITGGASALIGTVSSLMMGFADFPVEVLKAFKPKSSDESIQDGGQDLNCSSNLSQSLIVFNSSHSRKGQVYQHFETFHDR